MNPASLRPEAELSTQRFAEFRKKRGDARLTLYRNLDGEGRPGGWSKWRQQQRRLWTRTVRRKRDAGRTTGQWGRARGWKRVRPG